MKGIAFVASVSLMSALSSLASFQTALADAPTPTKIGTLSVQKPAFLSLESLEENGSAALVISSFNMFGSDGVSAVRDIGARLDNLDAARAEPLASGIRWPNEAKMLPKGTFPFPAMAISGGFLVPGKSTGAVNVLDTSSGDLFKLTTDKNGWFYHRSVMIDMNGDGRLDILTARATKPIIGQSKGELLWLEQPASGALEQAWTEHVISNRGDVHFRVADLDGDGSMEIIATEFFAKKLSITWRTPTGFESRVIDEALGSAFEVEVVDLNADGKKDLLVTNHESDANASVFAYEIPARFKTDAFKRHTLVTGIETRQRGLNQASPGAATAFHPNMKDAAGKPHILVSGDGSQRAHLLAPRSSEQGDWSYVETELVNAGATVGQSTVGDVNGDGFAEVFVPAYDKNTIHVFTFAPAAR